MTTVEERDAGIALPGEAAFDAATRVFNLAGPARPAAAVTARGVDQIRAAIRHAASEGLTVRVHTTGHGSVAGRPMGDAVLIRTELEGGVDIDARRRVARVPAGTLWGAVVEAAAAHGLAARHGSAATVGVVGYLLRGGLSFYGRRFGLASNGVRAIELVTADGELRRVDASCDPELFWALRGGGGGLGVVTAVEIDLFPAFRVVTGAAFWPVAHAGRLMRVWREWTLDAPWEVTTSLRVMNLPPVPGVPPVLASGTVLCVDGAVLGATEEDVPTARRHADSLLGPLRSVAEPLLDTWELTTPSAVLRAHMDPPEPVAFLGDHMLLSEIGEEGAAEFLRAVGQGSGSPLVIAGLRQLGGAYSAPDPAGGALGRLDARYSYSGSGVPVDPDVARSILDHCARVRAALAPWDTGRTAPTFVEHFEQPQRHLDPEQVEAVDRVRARVDPSGLFRGDIAPNTSAAY
ncbi:FAD-binding oxidoreductase [Streptosporangium carneum]|uniref:FAD-linked oxidase n=1 Tax=Streptosporangium carneum TaxID=47481 RepID=A0A9W6I7C8_9ACTN|nr:FAD-dependent oxidoreductase [Streptosporangium carneum]GLK12320.1 FAD-linked oxidase [Streptosporangium carneum]